MNISSSNELSTPDDSPQSPQGLRIESSRQRVVTGPIPSAEEFAKYKEVMPDLPERLVKQFEADSITNRELQKMAQSAEIELQKNAQKADIAYEKRSQWMAFSIILVGLISTFILAYLDKDTAAVTTGIGTLAIIFKGVFNKTSTSDKNNNDKD